MLLSKKEVNILHTAGFYKDLPSNLSAELGGDTLKKLINMKLLHLSRSKTACRLTQNGIALLSKAGMDYSLDKHPVGDGDLLTRRMQSAEIALALQQIGLNVFKTDEPKSEKESCYLSSYAMRRNGCSNVLGMSKFSGYFYTPENIYVIYHLGSKLSGFYPNTESDIFFRHSMMMYKNIKIVFLGGCNFFQMFSLLNRKKEGRKKNDCNFITALEQSSYPVSVIPLNLIGLRILRIISTPNYEEILLNKVRDAINADKKFIVILDYDIDRLNIAAHNFSQVHVLIAEEQINYLPSGFKTDNIFTHAIKLNTAERLLGIGSIPDYTKIPYTDKNGIGIEFEPVKERKKANG